MKFMKLGITGCTGRMGSTLIREIQSGAFEGLDLAGGSDRQGADLSLLPYPTFESTKDLFEASDAVIDFTLPEATQAHIALAVETKTPLIIGTTGLNKEIENDITKASKTIAIFTSANMSLGVNLLMALVEQTASKLGPDWDIEIFETHHKHKIDSPSGTALALGKSAQKGRGGGDFVIDRAGKRNTGDIGYAVQRGGDVIGEHTVTFFGGAERIELGHKASDRKLFAHGALKAAQWINGKPPGFYSMKDVLGL